MTRQLIKWLFVFVVTSACVDPIYFDVPPATDLLVIDGSITDEPGPYTIEITRGVPLDTGSIHQLPVPGVKATLHDDIGTTEEFIEVSRGIYRTTGKIRGTVGHSYHVTLEMPDGTTLQSTPEKMFAAGEILDIKHEFETRLTVKPWGPVHTDVFNIFLDGNAPVSAEGDQSFVRWRFTGTYKTVTNPELHEVWLQGSLYYKSPWPCSGFVVEPKVGGGELAQRNECTCCTCWVNEYETSPHLSDTELVANGQFRNVKVGEVSVSSASFYEKYRVQVEQMIISKKTFDFFKMVRTQKDAATNLFQPPSARIVGNITSSNPEQRVVGIFWAAAVARKSIYISESELPYKITPVVVDMPCDKYYLNATTTKPNDWVD